MSSEERPAAADPRSRSDLIPVWIFYAIALLSAVSFVIGDVPAPAMVWAIGGGVVVLLATALPTIRKNHRYTVIGLLAAALLFAITADIGLEPWLSGLGRSTSFCVFFAGIMLASRYLDPSSLIPVTLPPEEPNTAAADENRSTGALGPTGAPGAAEPPPPAGPPRSPSGSNAAPASVGYARSDSAPSLKTIGVLQFLASMGIGLGAVLVLQPLYAAHAERPRSVFRTLSAGYSLYVAMSPLDVVVNLVIGLAGVSFLVYLPVGIAVSIAFIGTLAASEAIRSISAAGRSAHRQRPLERLRNPNLLPFVGRILLVVAIVVVGHSIVTTADRISLTGLVLLVTSPVLLAAGGSRENVAEAIRSHPVRIRGILDVILVLIAATVFSVVFSSTDAADVIVSWIAAASTASPYLGVLAVVGITALAAVFGVHMLVLVTAIGTILTPAAVGLTAPGFAGMLMLSYLAGMNLSPLVPYTIAAGDVNGGRTSFQAALAGAVPWMVVVLAGPALLIALFGR